MCANSFLHIFLEIIRNPYPIENVWDHHWKYETIEIREGVDVCISKCHNILTIITNLDNLDRKVSKNTCKKQLMSTSRLVNFDSNDGFTVQVFLNIKRIFWIFKCIVSLNVFHNWNNTLTFWGIDKQINKASQIPQCQN